MGTGMSTALRDVRVGIYAAASLAVPGQTVLLD